MKDLYVIGAEAVTPQKYLSHRIMPIRHDGSANEKVISNNYFCCLVDNNDTVSCSFETAY